MTDKPNQCEACRRKQWRGPRMEQAHVKGVGITLLCVDPADCHRHWPAELVRGTR
jgi:hypothetical protein